MANTSDAEDIIEYIEPDASVIAAHAGDHYRVANKSSGAGKHTFVENPLSLTAKDAEQ